MVHVSFVGDSIVFIVRLYTDKPCVCGVRSGVEPSIPTVKRDFPLQ